MNVVKAGVSATAWLAAILRILLKAVPLFNPPSHVEAAMRCTASVPQWMTRCAPFPSMTRFGERDQELAAQEAHKRASDEFRSKSSPRRSPRSLPARRLTFGLFTRSCGD